MCLGFLKRLTSPKRLSYSVLQASQMLVLLNAALARVLKLQCGDSGRLSAGQNYLQLDSVAWQQAHQFIHLNNLIYDKFDGDAVAIRHWLRFENKSLEGVPLLLVIDVGCLKDVIDFLKIG